MSGTVQIVHFRAPDVLEDDVFAGEWERDAALSPWLPRAWVREIVAAAWDVGDPVGGHHEQVDGEWRAYLFVYPRAGGSPLLAHPIPGVVFNDEKSAQDGQWLLDRAVTAESVRYGRERAPVQPPTPTAEQQRDELRAILAPLLDAPMDWNADVPEHTCRFCDPGGDRYANIQDRYVHRPNCPVLRRDALLGRGLRLCACRPCVIVKPAPWSSGSSSGS